MRSERSWRDPPLESVVLTGDGGFLMSGMETATVARMRLPVAILVFRNDV